MEPVTKTYHRGADLLKFLLMPFVCFACFGLPGRVGFYIAQLSQFAAPAFFILCGFFDAEDEQTGNDHSKALIARTARRFLLLAAIFLACNAVLYLRLGVTPVAFVRGLLRRRVLFNFVVLCLWPFRMGETLWFIQSLLYVRIGLWLMGKLRLMRFYKIFMALGFAVMLVMGELAGLTGIRLFGYACLPTGWLTCAMPYMLLGRLVYEKREKLFALPPVLWITGLVLGASTACVEFLLLAHYGLLVYTGYAAGFAMMALCACCLFLRMAHVRHRFDFLTVHGKAYAWRIYAMSQVVAFVLITAAEAASAAFLGVVQTFGGIVVYLVCLLLAFLYGVLTRQMKTQGGEMIWNMKRRNERHKRRKQAEQRRKNDEAEV